AVEADQVVVLTARRYDPILGYAGGEGALYPALGDEATRKESASTANLGVPGEGAWPVRKEAIEVSWLLGQPVFVEIIPGPGDSIGRVVAGAGEANREAQRLLDHSWRQSVSRTADLVIASISGDPTQHTFADLAAAAACAARVVRSQGRIVLLT